MPSPGHFVILFLLAVALVAHPFGIPYLISRALERRRTTAGDLRPRHAFLAYAMILGVWVAVWQLIGHATGIEKSRGDDWSLPITRSA